MKKTEMQKEVIQLAINAMIEKIETKEAIIQRHPSNDFEFIEMQQRQKEQWNELQRFAVEWRDSI